MKNRCIGCKREIAKGQQQCYVCGLSQSYLRLYLIRGLIFFIILGMSAGIARWYANLSVEGIKAENVALLAASDEQSMQQIRRLEAKLKTANETLTSIQKSSTQSSEINNQFKLGLDEANVRAVKAEERASWLSKENRRFKAKIKELSEQVSRLKDDQEAAKASTEQLSLLKSELTVLEKQRLDLVQEKAVKIEKLKQSWQSNSEGTPVSNEVVQQREIQVVQVALNESNQIEKIEKQIEALRAKIQSFQ